MDPVSTNTSDSLSYRRYTGSIATPLDFTNFPFDAQVVSLQIVSATGNGCTWHHAPALGDLTLDGLERRHVKHPSRVPAFMVDTAEYVFREEGG